MLVVLLLVNIVAPSISTTCRFMPNEGIALVRVRDEKRTLAENWDENWIQQEKWDGESQESDKKRTLPKSWMWLSRDWNNKRYLPETSEEKRNLEEGLNEHQTLEEKQVRADAKADKRALSDRTHYFSCVESCKLMLGKKEGKVTCRSIDYDAEGGCSVTSGSRVLKIQPRE